LGKFTQIETTTAVFQLYKLSGPEEFLYDVPAGAIPRQDFPHCLFSHGMDGGDGKDIRHGIAARGERIS